MAAARCEHIRNDGVRCDAPVLYRRSFCYLHWRLRDHDLPVTEPAYTPPLIDSEASVVVASQQILRGVLSGRLDVRRAQVALSCLRMAAQAMRNQRNVSGITVTDLTLAMADDFAQAGAAAEAFARKTASATTSHEHESIPPTLSQVETDLPVCPVERSSTLNATNELQEETPAQELVILNEDARPSEGPRQPASHPQCSRISSLPAPSFGSETLTTA